MDGARADFSHGPAGTGLPQIKARRRRGTGAIPVEIPARYAVDGRGAWHLIRHGVRALLVADGAGHAVSYVICEPPNHDYKVMTGSDRMPAFVDERI